MNFSQFNDDAQFIREAYHQLEKQHHGKERSLEEDALAFLTDAALVGRMIMALEQRWPYQDAQTQLAHKLGECMRWIAVLAKRSGLDIQEITQQFLVQTKDNLLDH